MSYSSPIEWWWWQQFLVLGGVAQFCSGSLSFLHSWFQLVLLGGGEIEPRSLQLRHPRAQILILTLTTEHGMQYPQYSYTSRLERQMMLVWYWLSAWSCKGLDGKKLALIQPWQDGVALRFWSLKSRCYIIFDTSWIELVCNLGVLLHGTCFTSTTSGRLCSWSFMPWSLLLELLQCTLCRISLEEYMEVTTTAECGGFHNTLCFWLHPHYNPVVQGAHWLPVSF